jgi:hypothetical protein
MDIFDIRLTSNNEVVPVFKAILDEVSSFGNLKLSLATSSSATSPMSKLDIVNANDLTVDEAFKFRVVLRACSQFSLFEPYTLEQGCKGVDIT